MPSEWETARSESRNYVDEILQLVRPYGYADKSEAASTHKEICKFLQGKLSRAGENAHLADDFLRGPRTSDVDRALRNIKDEIEIFRDEVSSSFVDWKSPRSNIIREIISKDVQLLRHSSDLLKVTDEMREGAIARAANVVSQKAFEANEIMKKLSYLFSDRERLCR